MGRCRQDRFRRKRTDQLQLIVELMSELPLYFFQTPLSFLHWKLLPCKENKPRKLKSSSVFSKIISGSRGVARVLECHILSVNLNGQQQNKSFDVTEINFWLEFADGIFGGTSDSRKYVCVRRLGRERQGNVSKLENQPFVLWRQFFSMGNG